MPPLHASPRLPVPGFGGGDGGHLMRIRMTSLSLQPNDASTLQPSLINAVQWCGVDCPLHLLVYSLVLTLVIVSPSRRAEEQDMHGVRTVQVSLLTCPSALQVCMVQIKGQRAPAI
jgi:hypothetical protein